MATYSSILAWEIPWTEEPGRLSPRGLNGDPMCGRGAGLLLQSPAGEKVACFKSLKARIMVWAALGGGEFLVLGDSLRRPR